MLNKFSSRYGAVKVLLAGIYIAFFAVQLHYQFTGANQRNYVSGFHLYSAKNVENRASFKTQVSNHTSASSNIRLNRSYHPETLNALITAQANFTPNPVVNQKIFNKQPVILTPVFLFIHPLRGPPAGVLNAA